MYKLKTESFVLELEPKVYQSDLSYSVNTSLNVKVVSYGFSAESIIDIDVREFADFAVQLNELYETLGGSARLEEPYGLHSYIEFTGGDRGYIKVKGNISACNAYGYVQEITFQNEIEQTYLISFAKTLFADYKKYTEK